MPNGSSSWPSRQSQRCSSSHRSSHRSHSTAELTSQVGFLAGALQQVQQQQQRLLGEVAESAAWSRATLQKEQVRKAVRPLKVFFPDAANGAEAQTFLQSARAQRGGGWSPSKLYKAARSHVERGSQNSFIDRFPEAREPRAKRNVQTRYVSNK